MLSLFLNSQQSSPVQQLPQQSNIKSNSQSGYLLIYVHSVEPIWDKIKDQEFSFCLVISLDGNSNDSMKVFKSSALLQFDQNFFFSCKPYSTLKLQLMDGQKNKCHAFIQLPLLKIYNSPKVKHCMEVDMIDEQKMKTQKIADKVATLDIQLLHLIDNIGILELSIYDASLDRDISILEQMNPYLLIKIDGKLYNTGVCWKGAKNPKWNKRFQIPIGSVSLQMEIIAYNYNQQISNDKNMIGTSKSIDLMASKILVPTSKQKKQTISLYTKAKKIGVINMASKFVLNKA